MKTKIVNIGVRVCELRGLLAVRVQRLVRHLPRQYHMFDLMKGCAHGPKPGELPWWKIVRVKVDMTLNGPECKTTRHWFYTRWGGFFIEWD